MIFQTTVCFELCGNGPSCFSMSMPPCTKVQVWCGRTWPQPHLTPLGWTWKCFPEEWRLWQQQINAHGFAISCSIITGEMSMILFGCPHTFGHVAYVSQLYVIVVHETAAGVTDLHIFKRRRGWVLWNHLLHRSAGMKTCRFLCHDDTRWSISAPTNWFTA